MKRAFLSVALLCLGGAGAVLPVGCVTAQVQEAVRDPDFHGTIRRIVVVATHLLPSEQVLPELMQAEFARRKIACLAFAVSDDDQRKTLAARKAETDAFAPDAWMRIYPSDRLVDQGALYQTHYQVNVGADSAGDGRWIWRADVMDSGDSPHDRLALMAVRIADYMTAENLIARP